MSENRSGWRSLLSFPGIHNIIQHAVGVPKIRKLVLENNLMFLPGMKILDVGCGTGELIEYMPRNVEYTGFDFEKKYIEHAKKKYGRMGKFLYLSVNDASINEITVDTYDIVLLFSILHHLNDSEVKKLLKLVHFCLKPSGCALSLDGVYLKNQSKLSRFLLSQDRGRYVRKDGEYKKLAQMYFPHVTVQILRNKIRIPSDTIVMKMTK